MLDKILYMYHNSLLGGHAGFERMKNSIKKFYNWTGMIQDLGGGHVDSDS